MGSTERSSRTRSTKISWLTRQTLTSLFKSPLASSSRLSSRPIIGPSKALSSASCKVRHSFRSRAKIPVGSKPCRCRSTPSTWLSGQSMRSAIWSRSMRRYPASSRFSIRVKAIIRSDGSSSSMLTWLTMRSRSDSSEVSRFSRSKSSPPSKPRLPPLPQFSKATEAPTCASAASSRPCQLSSISLTAAAPSSSGASSAPAATASPPASPAALAASAPSAAGVSDEAVSEGPRASTLLSSRSSSGFFSSSRSMYSLSSTFDSCSSLMACCSWGVITSDWPCLSVRF